MCNVNNFKEISYSKDVKNSAFNKIIVINSKDHSIISEGFGYHGKQLRKFDGASITVGFRS